MKKTIYFWVMLMIICYGCTNRIAQNHTRETAIQSNTSNSHQIDHAKETKEQTAVYEPPKKQENYDHLTQKEVLTKLLNTVDNFDTAVGKFELLRNGYTTLVEYKIAPTSGYSKSTHVDKNSGKSRIQHIYYRDGNVWLVDEERKATRRMRYNADRHAGTLEPQQAFGKDSLGNNVTRYRERPPIGAAQTSLFPYEIASNFTRDLDKWEIEKQDEQLLDHNTIVLKGLLNEAASRKQGASTFRFWVDKDSGILVQFELYNAKGEVVDYLHPIELNVNVPIDRKELESNVESLLQKYPVENE
ncbi:outer membrane lipoprotein-sorting protein [Brevibacillus sp. WF146]|uniref:sigma-E factor regulatory protein RseB domain-containing protein n=1 Tax=Brevibacillus sp. WF146 TaxID=319501 RepID=UPI0007ED6ADA|nr:sigma-E factor regulatory protein RseB domain-containing protein [Brevibacillus sp. WF146]UYZ13763.1 outer membrane lipoprotein-sorting protein [Brevibacillus sp. WF146]